MQAVVRWINVPVSAANVPVAQQWVYTLQYLGASD